MPIGGDYVMTTSVSSINSGIDPRQMAQHMHLKNEKTAAQELKAEEQQRAENASIGKPQSDDLRKIHVNQAADAGILRPIWLEIINMDPDMPRISDIISGTTGKKNVKSEHVADGAKRAVKSERDTDGAERVFNSERAAADGDERAVKSGHAATDGAERAVKPESRLTAAVASG